MSLPLITRRSEDPAGPSSIRLLQGAQKISLACLACKLRKTKCTGGQLCDVCKARLSDCNYDAAADQRRKIARQRNLERLKEAQSKLESHRRFLGGVLTIIAAGDVQQISDLIHVIKTGVDPSQIAAHVRNGLRSSVALAQAYNAIAIEMDGPLELPAPAQLLSSLPVIQSKNGTSQHSEPLTTMQQGQAIKNPNDIFDPYLQAMRELRRGLNPEETTIGYDRRSDC